MANWRCRIRKSLEFMTMIGCLLVFVLTMSLASAHDVVIKRNSNLRADSNTDSEIYKLLKPGDSAKLLDIEKKQGYYHVLHDAGVGYVWANNVDIYPEYDRNQWKHWIDADGDCQNTRDEVLIQESVITVTLSEDGCKVIAGRWQDPYSGEVFTDPADLDVDHMVPLKNAHRSGGWAWTKQRRKEYANDLDHQEHLIAVDSGLNRSKGAQGPDTWLPPNDDFQCQYVQDWQDIKTRWGLEITDAERTAVEMVIANNGC